MRQGKYILSKELLDAIDEITNSFPLDNKGVLLYPMYRIKFDGYLCSGNLRELSFFHIPISTLLCDVLGEQSNNVITMMVNKHEIAFEDVEEAIILFAKILKNEAKFKTDEERANLAIGIKRNLTIGRRLDKFVRWLMKDC